MKATRQFLPSASSPLSVEEPSASTWPFFTFSPGVDQRLLVDQRALVRAHVLLERVLVLAVAGVDHDPLGVDVGHRAGVVREHHVAGVDRGARLHAGADQRRLRLQERHRLALHVRAHQRAVGVVVLEERDQRRGHRPDLVRRHVHQVDVLRRGEHELALARAALDRGPLSLPVFSSISAFACAITLSSSWFASRWTILSVTTPSSTTR